MVRLVEVVGGLVEVAVVLEQRVACGGRLLGEDLGAAFFDGRDVFNPWLTNAVQSLIRDVCRPALGY